MRIGNAYGIRRKWKLHEINIDICYATELIRKLPKGDTVHANYTRRSQGTTTTLVTNLTGKWIGQEAP